jgi:hypothetical protein
MRREGKRLLGPPGPKSFARWRAAAAEATLNDQQIDGTMSIALE